MNDIHEADEDAVPMYYGASISSFHIYGTPPLEPSEADKRIEACGSASALVELYEFNPMNSASRTAIATLL